MAFVDGNRLSQAQAEQWLSRPRFSTYLRACDGSVENALRLYEWNIDMGGVLMKDIAYLEIALRNAYDRVLTQRWHDGEGRHWLFAPNSPVNVPLARRASSGAQFDANALNRKNIEAAKMKDDGERYPDRTIANLSFGFWAHMTDRAHERVLWIPIVHHAWPMGTSRSSLDAKLRIVNTARNRIAHHEHLFNARNDDLLPVHVDRIVMELLGMLLPDIDFTGGFPETPVERYARSYPVNVDVGLDDAEKATRD